MRKASKHATTSGCERADLHGKVGLYAYLPSLPSSVYREAFCLRLQLENWAWRTFRSGLLIVCHKVCSPGKETLLVWKVLLSFFSLCFYFKSTAFPFAPDDERKKIEALDRRER